MFNAENFAKELLAESIFFDAENGFSSTVMLIDADGKERFYAFEDGEEGEFVIEEATEWEPVANEDGEFMATDGKEVLSFEEVEEIAQALYELAASHQLLPRVFLVLEGEEEE